MDEGGNLVVLTDENGDEFELELLSTLEYHDEIYMAFAPTEVSDDDDEIGIVILKSVEEEDGEEVLVTVDDDELLEKVYELFMKNLDAEDQEDAGDNSIH